MVDQQAGDFSLLDGRNFIQIRLATTAGTGTSAEDTMLLIIP
jgi:hypothetical protein